jgi:hypothetical protein
MTPKITVELGHSLGIRVDVAVFEAWFPDVSWAQHFDTFRGGFLVDKLYMRLKQRYNINKHEVRLAIVLLLQELKHFHHIHGETRSRVSMTLGQVLRQELFTRGYDDEMGFYNSRHCFIILAYLAEECTSVYLAQALLQFSVQFGQDIAQDHQAYLISEWQPALKKVQDLLAREMMPEPLPMMPYAGMFRGRAPRHLGLPFPGYRARSAPPRRRPNSDMHLLMPAYPSSAYTSPMISPAMVQPSGFFDDVGRLQYQQEEMNMKLDNVDGKLFNVDQKLEYLIHNGLYAA